MRKSKADAEATRLEIIEAAAREFRRNGIRETGVTEVMSAAGLTHGGFYRHFASKRDLVAAASAAGMESILRRAGALADRPGGRGGLSAVIGGYLATKHRDDRGEECPLAALGSELARADEDTRAVVSSAIVRFIELIADQMPRQDDVAAKSRAMLILSAMVGALTLSRLVTNPELSETILRETRRQLVKS